jgi:predicted DNA-binding transcriptional regulator AlpA
MSLEHSPARDGQNFGTVAEPFVSERKAAEFLGISVRTLQRWRTEPPSTGGPRFFKLGAKRVAYRLSDLTKWAEGLSYQSTSEADAA